MRADGPAPPVTSAVLQAEVGRLLRKYGRHPESVLLIRAEQRGNGFEPFRAEGRRVRVVSCVSPLAVLAEVTGHLEAPEGGRHDVLVVLTSADEVQLGDGLLGRALRQRVFDIEPWVLVRESFGARQLEPRLMADQWAGRALLDAMPPGGQWARLPGAVLTRDEALRALAARRLRLDRLGIEPDQLDADALLSWSMDAELVAAFGALRADERRGLIGWLRDTVGGMVEPLFALVAGGSAGDALPLGLVCAALWRAEGEAPQAVGAVRYHITSAPDNEIEVDDRSIGNLGSAAEDLVRILLEDEPAKAHRVLEQADRLAARFGAGPAVRHSPYLLSGLEARIEVAGERLGTALDGNDEQDKHAKHGKRDKHDKHGNLGDLAAEIKCVAAHTQSDKQPSRVRRLQMAQRLLQWLAGRPEPVAQVTGVGAAVRAQVGEWAWVDRAVDDIWAGEETNTTVQRAYRTLYERVRELRRKTDEAFASRLAAWGGPGPEPGGLLSVESVLPRLVAPMAGKDGPAALLLVLDGMTVAVATELAAEMRAGAWSEYDPLPNGDSSSRDEPRRRGVVAALPTVTQVSRASLFAGRIMSGGQDVERTSFETHSAWRGRPARLFHKGALQGGAGETLGEDLVGALDDVATTVAVVLNAIDDSLDRGRADVAWGVDDVAGLSHLLRRAALVGRPVVMTSDHGHVLGQGGHVRNLPDAISARHRTGTTPADDGEVELTGSRVIPDGRIVALWDRVDRYAAAKAGYHGGASLAEVVIPLMGFLPFGTPPPKGWRPLPDQAPAWWSLAWDGHRMPDASVVSTMSAGSAGSAMPAVPAATAKKSRTRKKPVSDEPTLFGEPGDPHDPSAPRDTGDPSDTASGAPPAETVTAERPARSAEEALVARLLDTELFQAQLKMIPRKIPTAKLERVLVALLESATLPLPVLAEKAGEKSPVRARGFASTLQRILNIENYPVLGIIDNGRNVTVDRTLLVEQFELKER